MLNHNHQSKFTKEQIKEWAYSIAYQLDNPSVVTLNEITSVVKSWEDNPDFFKFCFILPVEYSAMVANLGVAILYDELNSRKEGVIAERCYFPEKKLLTRLKKEGLPLFSKENFVPLKNFECIAMSSYYPVQYLNVPPILEMSGIPVWSKERDGLNAPIFIGGGISFYNAEPVSDFFDAFFIGEGEDKLYNVVRIMKECRVEGGIDKDRLLHRLAKETDYMYVPSFYDVKYYDGYGVKERVSLNEDAKPVIKRAIANIYEIPPLTKTFVPIIESADMSIGSCECTRGCAASPIYEDSLVEIKGLDHLVPLKEVKVGNEVRFNTDFHKVEAIHKYEHKDTVKIGTEHGYSLILEPDHEVLVLTKFGQVEDKRADEIILGEDYVLMPRTQQQFFEDKSKQHKKNIDLAFLAGFIAGDGYFSKRGDLGFCTISKALEVEEKIISIIERYYNFRPTVRTCHKAEFPGKKRDTTDVRHFATRNKELKNEILKRINKINCYDVSCTQFMFEATFEEKAAFVRGLYEADGTVSKKGQQLVVSLTSVSKQLILDTQRILNHLGVFTCVSTVKSKGKKLIYGRECNIRDSYHLDVCTRKSFEIYSKFIGFESKEKNDLLNYHISHLKNDINHIPYIASNVIAICNEARKLGKCFPAENRREVTKRTSHQRKINTSGVSFNTVKGLIPFLQDFISAESLDYLNFFVEENFFYSKVITRENYGKVNTRCLTLKDEPHYFTAEGIVVHNCSFCEGSARTLPIRERDTDTILKAFDEIKRETGVKDVTPYGFNLSDHSNIRTIIKELMKDQDVKVQMSCQPAGEFIWTTDGLEDVSYVKKGSKLDNGNQVTYIKSGLSSDLYSLHTALLPSQRFTGEHPIKVYDQVSHEFKWVPVKDLKKDQLTLINLEEFPRFEQQNLVYGETIGLDLMEDVVQKLIAYYISNGYLLGSAVYIKLEKNQIDEDSILFISNLTTHFSKYNIEVIFDGPEKTVEIRSGKVVSYFRSLGFESPSGKAISPILLNLDSDSINFILDSMLEESKLTPDSKRFIFFNKKIATMFCLLALKANRFYILKEKGSALSREYEIILFDERRFLDKNRIFNPITKLVSQKDENVKVFSIETTTHEYQTPIIVHNSQRIDMFSEDFASLAHYSGNNSITLAVESGSDRMRKVINKNLTRQQIMEAMEIAFKIGFNKIKIYMIANLPFELPTDIDGTPTQLIGTKDDKNNVLYEDKDAVEIEFDDGTKMIVSEEYFFNTDSKFKTQAKNIKVGDTICLDC